MRTLFVTHKWGLGLPDTGVNPTHPLTLHSFLEWGKGTAQVIWTDVTHFGRGPSVRAQMQEARESFKPDVVIYTPIMVGQPGLSDVRPEHMHEAGCPAVVWFFDLSQPSMREFSEPYAQAADLSVGIDSAMPIGRRFIQLWPVFPNRPSFAKTVDISFQGGYRGFPDRREALERLAQEGIDVKVVSGPLDGGSSSLSDYYQTLDDSLMVLSFGKTVLGADQVKGRPFEAAAAHCCVVEQRTSTTAWFFEPDTEFAAWNDLDDLVRVVKTLLADKDQARRIAARGHDAYRTKWSPARFWDVLSGAVATLPRPGAR